MDFRFLIPVLVSFITLRLGYSFALNLAHGAAEAVVLWQCVITLAVDFISILFCRSFFKDQKSNLQFGWPGKNQIIVCIILCIIIGMSMNLFSQWVLFCFPDLTKFIFSPGAVEKLGPAIDQWYYILWAGILAPILEEIFFRGYIVEQCARRNGMRMAIISGAVIFAFFHMNLYMALYTFLFGLLLNYIYIETRSLWLTILIHIANNLTRKILPPALLGHVVITGDERNLYWFAVIAASGAMAVVCSLVLLRKNRSSAL